MGKYLNNFYSRFSANNFLEYIKLDEGKINWVIEAGCHDGNDTLEFVKFSNVKVIYAFEPDPIAREIAMKTLEPYLTNLVKLYPYALSNSEGEIYLVQSHGNFGNGTSEASEEFSHEIPHVKIKKVRLNRIVSEESSNGILWLDVEGHAVEALVGAGGILNKLIHAKIEVQMHTLNDARKADSTRVLQIMRKAGHTPIMLPLHPGFFGDIVFTKATELSISKRAYSLVLVSLFRFLHLIIYPMLGKPGI
ncbi:MAG: FkbM family methyltransferase [Actinobacteria bacterium]|nr:FkbM family methyltransferase [Actinomycetota bacterium]